MAGGGRFSTRRAEGHGVRGFTRELMREMIRSLMAKMGAEGVLPEIIADVS